MLRKTPVALASLDAWGLFPDAAATRPLMPRAALPGDAVALRPAPTIAEYRRLALQRERRYDALTCQALLAVAVLVFWLLPLSASSALPLPRLDRSLGGWLC